MVLPAYIQLYAGYAIVMVALAGVWAHGWWRERDSIGAGMSWSAGLLALAATAWILGHASATVALAARPVIAIALVGSAAGLLRTGAARVPRWQRRGAFAVLVLIATVSVADGRGPLRPMALPFAAWGAAVLWAAGSAFRSAGRAPVTRRAPLLGVALTIVMMGAGSALVLSSAGRPRAGVVAGMGVLGVVVGFVPPVLARRAGAVRAQRDLREAVELVAFEPDGADVTRHTVESAVRLVGASWSFLIAADLTTLASCRISSDDAQLVWERVKDAASPRWPIVTHVGPPVRDVVVVPMGPAHAPFAWLVTAAAHLGEPFSRNEIDMLRRVAATAAVACERVRIGQEVVLQAARYRRAIEHVSDGDEGVIAVESERITWANAAACRILGRSVSDLRSFASPIDLIAPDERERLRGLVHRSLALHGEPAPTYQTVMLGRLGRRVDVAVSVAAIEPSRFVIFLRDVSERLRHERGAAGSGGRVLNMYESIPEGFFALDRGWRFVYMNNVAARMRGREAASVVGRTIWEVFPDLRATRFYSEFHRAMAEMVPVHFEEYDARVDAWFDVSAYASDEGLAVYLRDVTGRRRAEEELRASEERFRISFEHAPIGMAVLDLSGRLAQVNERFCDLVGSPAGDLLGADLTAITHPADRDQSAKIRHQLLEGDTSRTVAEMRLLRRDGSDVWVQAAISLVRDGLERPMHFIGQYQDVTERRRLQEALQRSERAYHDAYEREREAVERLETLHELKNAFLTAVSHELRTPLTSVVGFAETLRSAGPRLEQGQRDRLLDRLHANAQKLNRLLSDLLDLDRVARGIVEPCRRPVEVGALVRRIVESEADALVGRAISIDGDPVVAAIDGPKVERIVENLLMNAVKHTSPGTPVWVRIRPSDDAVEILVEDAGPGVPYKMRDTVFEPFRQGTSINGHSPGVGIGLSLVARFAELHGGRAWVRDRPGGGASFGVLLPGALGEVLPHEASASSRVAAEAS